MRWFRALFGRSGRDGVHPLDAGPADPRARDLADFCRDRHERGRTEDEREFWEWVKARNPELMDDIRRAELAAHCRDSFPKDDAEEKRLLAEWKAEYRKRAEEFNQGSWSVG